jgi:hypothetical protein
LLDNGSQLAQRAAVIDASLAGDTCCCSPNPFLRAETQGSHFVVFNAILNIDNLPAGRELASK